MNDRQMIEKIKRYYQCVCSCDRLLSIHCNLALGMLHLKRGPTSGKIRWSRHLNLRHE